MHEVLWILHDSQQAAWCSKVNLSLCKLLCWLLKVCKNNCIVSVLCIIISPLFRKILKVELTVFSLVCITVYHCKIIDNMKYFLFQPLTWTCWTTPASYLTSVTEISDRLNRATDKINLKWKKIKKILKMTKLTQTTVLCAAKNARNYFYILTKQKIVRPMFVQTSI